MYSTVLERHGMQQRTADSRLCLSELLNLHFAIFYTFSSLKGHCQVLLNGYL